jgi:hypothetical protein
MRPSKALKELHHQHTIIRDRLRGVVLGHSNGMYLFGRPGTSKTYMVTTALKEWATPHVVRNGNLSAIGLCDLIAENHDRPIVLDDVSKIFGDPQALQIFLAALGTPHDGSRERLVRHKTANGDRSVRFTGGIIAISNLSLHGKLSAVVNALRDRVHMIEYDPTDEQILAQINDIAVAGPRGVLAKDARTVAKFIAANLSEGMRLTIRMFVDKALPSFRQWQDGQTEAHWTDLVRADLKEQTVSLTHETRDLSRADQTAAERRIVLWIYQNYENRKERLAQWKAQTGKSPAAFYRRLDELRKEGKL